MKALTARNNMKDLILPEMVATDFLKIAPILTNTLVSHWTSPYSAVSALPNYLPYVASLTTFTGNLLIKL